MDKYNQEEDLIKVNNEWVSPERAKHIAAQIDSALDLRELFLDAPELHGIGINERAVRLLTGDRSAEDTPVRVGLAFEDKDDLADEYIIRWEEMYGDDAGDVIMNEDDVEAFFKESEGIEGIHIESYMSMADI